MSTTQLQPPTAQAGTGFAVPKRAASWIINFWWDQWLIIFTPVAVVLAVLFVRSPLVRLEVETISLMVGAFGALGHHLPGMIRAYGDPELFQRFRGRFIVAPIALFAVFFPLFHYERGAMVLILLFWAYWHGLMQVYGFVRIYDSKVGSTSPVTAYLDWLVCLFGFTSAQFFSAEKISAHLEYWYDMGGGTVPPALISSLRAIFVGALVLVLTAFLVNHVYQTWKGRPPNPIKFFMLASGIGCWWLAIVFIQNLLLGIAIFEVVHDIQYLAIVWIYNCRRVNLNPQMGAFMRFVFQRSMLMLYLGLILAYGSLGLVHELSDTGFIKTLFSGILWTSTIMHFYYDGFIWKVREKSIRASFGLNEAGAKSRLHQLPWQEIQHLLKWCPLILVVGGLFLWNSSNAAVPQDRRRELDKTYTQSVSAKAQLPQKVEEQSWLYTHFQHIQNIAAASPNDRKIQLRAAIMRANFGRIDEAVPLVEKLISEYPSFAEAYLALGDIELKRGNLDQAIAQYQTALSHAPALRTQAGANFKLGEAYLLKKDRQLAEEKLQQATKQDPKLKSAVQALLKEQGLSDNTR